MPVTTTGKATEFITFSRASNATVIDSDGKVKWAPHNLVLNSATPATQSITVLVGAQYTVAITGAGSVALSGAATGTVTAASPATVKATTTTLTLTVTAPVTTMWAYRSDLGGMQANAQGSLYNPTTGSIYYGPRRDFDPVTLACKGLLVEEQRTNLYTNSDELNDTSWAKSEVTVTANVTIAPDGAQTADKVVESTSTTTHIIRRDSVSIISGTSYTVSIFAKASERQRLRIVSYNGSTDIVSVFNLSSGAVISGSTASIVSVGNGWYRCSHTFTAAATTTTNFACQFHLDNGTTNSYTGDGTSGLFLWGAQLEAGSFATSYIPTGAATATRNGDVASVSTQAFPYSATEGTLVANVTLTASPATQTFCLYALSDGTTSERILVATGAGSGGNINSLVTDGGVLQAQTVNGSLATAGTYKYGNIFKVDDFASVVNGGAAVTDTSGTVPTMTVLHIGSSGLGSSQINGHIRQITYLPRRISNAELQARTQ